MIRPGPYSKEEIHYLSLLSDGKRIRDDALRSLARPDGLISLYGGGGGIYDLHLIIIELSEESMRIRYRGCQVAVPIVGLGKIHFAFKKAPGDDTKLLLRVSQVLSLGAAK